MKDVASRGGMPEWTGTDRALVELERWMRKEMEKDPDLHCLSAADVGVEASVLMLEGGSKFMVNPWVGWGDEAGGGGTPREVEMPDGRIRKITIRDKVMVTYKDLKGTVVREWISRDPDTVMCLMLI